MQEDSGYTDGEGAIAEYDQLKAHAIAQLRECDSFLCIVGAVDNQMGSGMRLTAVSATKTPFAPYFLSEACCAASTVMLQSIEALVEEGLDEEPA